MNRQKRRHAARSDRRRKKRPGSDRRTGVSERRATRSEEPGRFHIDQAIGHHQNGEFDKAAMYYRRFLDQNPDNARVLQLLGDTLYHTGRIDNAIEVLQRSIALEPGNALAHNNLGNAMRDMGSHDEAASCYREAISAKADFAVAYNNMGNLHRDRGELAAAETCYRKALDIEPGHAMVHYNLGNVLQDRGKADEAGGHYQSAIALDPGFALAHNNLGNVLRGKGMFDAAVECYRRAVEADKRFALGHYNLANIFKDQGKRDDALAAYRVVLELDPDNAYATHMINALAGETTPKAPRDFVREVFDSYAQWFESHLEGELEYRAPALMRDAVDRVPAGNGAGVGAGFRHALDLGCGTGLVGAHFNDRVERIHGVDISTRMLAEARRKKIYDDLDEADIGEFLSNEKCRQADYDLALAGDVFIYVGDLDAIFAGIRRCLMPGGLFSFSIESTAAAAYELRNSGRYAQNPDYIHTLADAHGFTVEIEDPITVRKEKDAPVDGLVYVLSRDAA